LNGNDNTAAKNLMINEAVELGANEATLTSCVDANTYSSKINNQMNVGTEIFGIT
jgi:hypothetical protein